MPGPPRTMLTMTAGSSSATRYEMPSCLRLMPGPLDEVMARAPAAEAPSTMLMAAISLSDWMNTPPDSDHALGHVLGELVLRSDGIAEVGGAAGKDRRLAQRGVAAHQPLHAFSTSMATSGHMSAQMPQPLQLSLAPSKAATK